MRKAIIATLEMWSSLDEQHKGKEYMLSKDRLEKWLTDETTTENN